MNRPILVAIIALAIGCADTVVGPSDGGTLTIDRNPTPDVSEDVAPSDLGSPDVFQSDADPLDQGVIDGGVPQDVAADSNTRDAAGLFTDAPFTGEGCNDLFPALPIMTAMRSGPSPRDYRGGEIPDGTYHLVRLDLYPSTSPRPLYVGQTIVVRGDTIQIASVSSRSDDFSRAFIQRSTCLVNRPMSPETELCTYSCKANLVGIHPFQFHEMRGSQMILADVETVYTFDRVAP
jgi:hypothetical protein